MENQKQLLKFIVVDDEAEITEFISYILRKTYCNVRTAGSGEEAIPMICESPPDILITDINMSGMSGVELTEHVLKLYPDTVVIAITGYKDVETAVEFMKRGGYDFLLKPVSFSAMQIGLESAVHRFRLKQELKKAHEDLKQKNISLEKEILERKQCELFLRISEQGYRDIFDNAPIGIFQTSVEGRLMKANHALARMFGYDSPDEMISAVTDIGAQLYADPAERKQLIKELMNHTGWLSAEKKFLRKDRSVFHVKATLRMVRSPEGLPLYLEGFDEDITEEKQQSELFDMEMSRARKIYNRVLEPALPVMTNIGIHVKCIPASKVGGDMAEVLKTEKGKLLFFLADVTGHGIPAAMTANTLKMLFGEVAETVSDPLEICRHLNSVMYKIILADDIIAAFCGQIDPEEMTLTYCLCGIPSPIIIRKHEKIRLKPTGLPLGVFDDSVCREITIPLCKDDLLIAFTDGITEARDSDGDIFGLKRVENIIGTKRHDVNTIVEDIITSAAVFQGGNAFQDDVILLALSLRDEKEMLSVKPCSRFCSPDKCVFKIKTRHSNVDDVTDFFVRHIGEKTALPDGRLKKVRAVFFEMLANAVEHGNLELTEFKKNYEIYDSDKYQKIYNERIHSDKYGERQIFIQCLYKFNRIEVSIEDQGRGFDMTAVSDPTHEDNLVNMSGRGIFLAKKNAAKITYNDVGNKVTMTFLLDM
ncbi:MAG: hypothetical protein BWK80_60825 [Desulfobacteraceae bacterium IS3]|nr:MAG: hypothetical protein BWK80_60825 [Desulfobacteraceae bacterium IS3]